MTGMALKVRTRVALWFAVLFLAGGAVIVAGMVYSAQKYMFADSSLTSTDIEAVEAARGTEGDAAAKAATGERMERQPDRLGIGRVNGGGRQLARAADLVGPQPRL